MNKSLLYLGGFIILTASVWLLVQQTFLPSPSKVSLPGALPSVPPPPASSRSVSVPLVPASPHLVSANPTWLTYESREPPYTVHYPKEFTVRKYDNSPFSTGGPRITLVGPISIVINPVPDDRSGSFEDWAQQQARKTCDADGPYGATTCPSVSKILPFTSAAGAQGYEIYLKFETIDNNGHITSTATRGPIFIFDVSQRTQQNRMALIILFYTNTNDSIAITTAERQLYLSIVDTIRF